MTFKEAYDYLSSKRELNASDLNDKEAMTKALSALKWACQTIDAMSKFLGKAVEKTKFED